jgi:hypothetical protein
MATYYFELIEEGGTVYVIRINELSIESFNMDDFVLPAHTHTKSDITDLETITTTPTPNAIPKADENGKISYKWIDLDFSGYTPLSQSVNQYKYKWLFHPEALKDIEFDIEVLDVIKLPIPSGYPGDQVYGEFIHVDLVYNPNGILAPDGNKYPFWIAYSPYHNMQGDYGNPCVAYSKDGITWRSDFTLPLIKKPLCGSGFECNNSDPELFELDDGRLCLINRVAVQGLGMSFRTKSSYSLEFMVYTPGSGWSDQSVFAHTTQDVLKCPSVVKDTKCGEREFVLFTTQAYTDLRRQTLTFSEDYSSATIGDATICNVINVDTGEPVFSDHVNIRFLDNQYVGIILDADYNLYWVVSVDGYTFYAKKIIFWDEVIGLGFPYRADFIVQEDGSILLYLPFALDYFYPFLFLVKAIPGFKTEKPILRPSPVAWVDVTTDFTSDSYYEDSSVHYYLSFVDKSGRESNKFYIGTASLGGIFNVNISINDSLTPAYKYKLYRSYNSDSMLNITDVYPGLLDPGSVIVDNNSNWISVSNTTIVGTGGKVLGYDETDGYIFTNKGIKVGEIIRPPFVVESTELVENLNVDLLDGKHASDFALLNGNNTFTGINTFGSSVAFPITYTDTDLTLTDAHYTVLVDAEEGDITITLPSARGIGGRIYVVKKIDSSENTVTVRAQQWQTIDNVTYVTLSNPNASIIVQADGYDSWYIIGYYGGI